jgi:hypothetical protein
VGSLPCTLLDGPAPMYVAGSPIAGISAALG